MFSTTLADLDCSNSPQNDRMYENRAVHASLCNWSKLKCNPDGLSVLPLSGLELYSRESKYRTLEILISKTIQGLVLATSNLVQASPFAATWRATGATSGWSTRAEGESTKYPLAELLQVVCRRNRNYGFGLEIVRYIHFICVFGT